MTLPIKLSGNYPLITAEIDGVDVPLVLDTGDSANVALAQGVLDRIKATPTGASGRALDAMGNALTKPKYKVRHLRLGGIDFADVTAQLDVHDPTYQASQVGQQGFLGTGLLKPYRVVVDYPHLTLMLMTPGSARSGSGSCEGVAVPFARQFRGEPATEVSTDRGKLLMWWDTGTPTSVFSKRIIGKARSRGDEPPVRTRHLYLAGIDFGKFEFEVPDLSLPPDFDGLMGYSFFARHAVCFDFPGKQLRIRR